MDKPVEKNLIDVFPFAGPFTHQGRDQAVLMIHGFTGTPGELRPLGDYIHQTFSWHVHCPLLPGHGTTLKDLEKIKSKQYDEFVQDEFNALKRRFSKIHLVGLSMGSCLVLDLCLNETKHVTSVSFLAPALWLYQPLFHWIVSSFRFMPLDHCRVRFLKPPKKDPNHITYKAFPIKALKEFSLVIARARSLSKNIKTPSLIAHSLADRTVRSKSAYFLFEHCSHEIKTLITLKNAIHPLPLSQENTVLFDAFNDFYKKIV